MFIFKNSFLFTKTSFPYLSFPDGVKQFLTNAIQTKSWVQVFRTFPCHEVGLWYGWGRRQFGNWVWIWRPDDDNPRKLVLNSLAAFSFQETSVYDKYIKFKLWIALNSSGKNESQRHLFSHPFSCLIFLICWKTKFFTPELYPVLKPISGLGSFFQGLFSIFKVYLVDFLQDFLGSI